MSDQLHIIVAGDESKTRNFLFSKRRLKISLFITVSLFITLSAISYNVLHFFTANKNLTIQVAALNKQLLNSNTTRELLALQVQNLQELNNNQSNTFQHEKATLINTALTELEERSGMIERIMCNIGIDVNKIPAKSDNKNSGGPFIEPIDTVSRELLFRSDRYMEKINFLPLGRPIPGRVTSSFGHRTDPVNGKKGFHSGVDMRGRYGEKIVATADGTVIKSLVNGSYGQYVEISHGNGYTTKFAHMKKRLVKRGEKVKRGQTLGTVGSSGRSTGPHLHYEVCLNKKPLNPGKFMQVSKLALAPPILRIGLKKKQKIKHQLVAENTIQATLEK